MWSGCCSTIFAVRFVHNSQCTNFSFEFGCRFLLLPLYFRLFLHFFFSFGAAYFQRSLNHAVLLLRWAVIYSYCNCAPTVVVVVVVQHPSFIVLLSVLYTVHTMLSVIIAVILAGSTFHSSIKLVEMSAFCRWYVRAYILPAHGTHNVYSMCEIHHTMLYFVYTIADANNHLQNQNKKEDEQEIFGSQQGKLNCDKSHYVQNKLSAQMKLRSSLHF